MRFRRSLKDVTWPITDSASITKTPPTTTAPAPGA
jgi:hypothetical protein